jgi:hypothetical protein
MTTSGTGFFYDAITSDRRQVAVEMRLGAAIDMQVRQMFTHDSPPAAAAPGAFAKLAVPLEAAATLPVPLHALVVGRPDFSAMAVPGGRIYVCDGLLPLPRGRRSEAAAPKDHLRCPW